MNYFKKIPGFKVAEWVTPEALNVSPNLLGLPLAHPNKRVLAIALDAAIIALLSEFGFLWLLAGILIGLFVLMELKAQSWMKKMWIVIALLLMSVMLVVNIVEYYANLTSPAIETPSKTAKTDEGKSAVVVDKDNIDEINEAHLDRIEELENELKLAKLSKPIQWREQLKQMANSVGAQFGWAVLYFTFLPFWWNGQTLGKKIFGIRILELTGRKLTVLNYFGRYGGYAAGMATGMVGFLQILWDDNRQGIQDKIAHTVVIDIRKERRLDLMETVNIKYEPTIAIEQTIKVDALTEK